MGNFKGWIFAKTGHASMDSGAVFALGIHNDSGVSCSWPTSAWVSGGFNSVTPDTEACIGSEYGTYV